MAKPRTPFPRNLHPSAYGGVLRRRRLGRGARSVSTRYSMHLVLRSSQARGLWSFVKARNRDMIHRLLHKQARACQVELLGVGNAGNHLHLRAQFTSRRQYCRFIRAIAGEIALKIKRIANPNGRRNCNFWDQRPFSSIVSTMKYAARLVDYVRINQLEGQGYPRAYARLMVQSWADGDLDPLDTG